MGGLGRGGGAERGAGAGAGLGRGEATAGRDKTWGHLGRGLGGGPRCLQPRATRGQPSSSSAPLCESGPGMECLSWWIWGAQFPRFGIAAMGSPQWREPLALLKSHPGQNVPWLPGPRATTGHRHLGQGNGANQALNPKQSCPARLGGCSNPHPPTQHRTPMPRLRPHASASPRQGPQGRVCAPSLGTGRT